MAWGGRHLVIGFTAGDIPKIPLNLPLIKGCSIVGVWIGAFAKRDPARHRANAKEIWKWFAEGKIKPHISGSIRSRGPQMRSMRWLGARSRARWC
jgi:NADPH2:quinone reductase